MSSSPQCPAQDVLDIAMRYPRDFARSADRTEEERVLLSFAQALAENEKVTGNAGCAYFADGRHEDPTGRIFSPFVLEAMVLEGALCVNHWDTIRTSDDIDRFIDEPKVPHRRPSMIPAAFDGEIVPGYFPPVCIQPN